MIVEVLDIAQCLEIVSKRGEIAEQVNVATIRPIPPPLTPARCSLSRTHCADS